jgi:ankyrin repeat protein
MSGSEEEISDQEFFMQCCRYGDFEDLMALCGEGFDPTYRDERGNCGLHMAAANGHMNVLEFLFTHISDVNV